MPEKPKTITIQPEPDTANESQLAIQDPNSILRYAIDKGAGVDVMERLLVLHEKMKASAAKEAFDLALSSFQSECPTIVKKKFGAKQAYKYAPLDEIVQQTRALMRKHGFSFTVSGDIEPGWVKAIVKVTHALGHSESSEFKVPVDNKNPMMNDPQRYGGAMTFAKRYCLCNAFGILTADDDLDARDHREIEAPIGPQKPKQIQTQEVPTSPPAQDDGQAKTLKSRIWNHVKAHFGNDLQAFQQDGWNEGWLTDTETLAELPASRLQQVLKIVLEKYPSN